MKRSEIELVKVSHRRCVPVEKTKVLCQFKRGKVSCRMWVRVIGRIGKCYVGAIAATPPQDWLDVMRFNTLIHFYAENVAAVESTAMTREHARMVERIKAKAMTRTDGQG